MKLLSVVICSHNPSVDRLSKVLSSLQQQSVPFTEWNLIVVDNSSKPAIDTLIDLSWHPSSSIVVEPNLGLFHARIRAIQETSTELMLILDDDTSIQFDYIENVLRIANENPMIGCFGGNQLGVFENEPNQSIKPYLELVGHRVVSSARIANFYSWNNTPAGAGATIRTLIARVHAANVANSNLRKSLGKKGDQLMTSEDIDMAYTSIDLGYLNGLFPELVLHHYLPAKHLETNYLVKRTYSNTISNCLLEFDRFKSVPNLKPWYTFFLQVFKLALKGKLLAISMVFAQRRGTQESIKRIAQLQQGM
jgi:glycosyltransferase involved in cell wall biosynthesis